MKMKFPEKDYTESRLTYKPVNYNDEARGSRDGDHDTIATLEQPQLSMLFIVARRRLGSNFSALIREKAGSGRGHSPPENVGLYYLD
jgi:hypothetical protein